ncbi:MAG: hypothetical protein ABFQ62_05105 [Patescibacteria group bacterium]
MKNKKQLKKKESTEKRVQELETKLEDLAWRYSIASNPYGKENIVKVGTKQIKKINKGEETSGLTAKDPAFQMMTLYEFENCNLLTHGFSDAYKVLATDMSRQLQQEYDCKTQSEKATAHLTAQNYVRTLELQREVSFILQSDSFSDLRLKRLSILEKAYDRANKQYLLSVQTLKSLKQPPINMTVKAQTANVANQQLIKQDNYE